MTNAAKAHDAKYLSFVLAMLDAERAEFADIARINASMTKYQGSADTTAETIRPSKK